MDDISSDEQLRNWHQTSVFRSREHLRTLLTNGVNNLIIGIGNPRSRMELGKYGADCGFALLTAIHPRAILAADAVIGKGSVIAAGAIVNPGSEVGDNVVLNTASSVDHDCIIRDGAQVAPGVRLAGGVDVGHGAWVGIGATLIEGVKVGAHAVIGAGSLVLGEVPRALLLTVSRPESYGELTVHITGSRQRVAWLMGVKHCIAMCNGTVALEIAIRAFGANR